MAKLQFTNNGNLQTDSIRRSHSWEADSLSVVYILPAFCWMWKVTFALQEPAQRKVQTGWKFKFAILHFVGWCTAKHFERHCCFRPHGSPRSFLTLFYLVYLEKQQNSPTNYVPIYTASYHRTFETSPVSLWKYQISNTKGSLT